MKKGSVAVVTPTPNADMSYRESNGTLFLDLPASTVLIDRADRRIAQFIEKQAAAINVFEVRILVREALLNAVIHGSGKDATRIVRVEVSFDDNGLVLQVEDEGPGFSHPREDVAFDILGDGGRGLPLLQIYSDEIHWNDRGNRVLIRKHYAKDTPASLAS